MKESLQKNMELIKKLRKECPWDRKQTIHSVMPCLKEEVQEALQAANRNDADSLREELGDILWDVLFIANLAEERGLFTIKEILDNQHQKMVDRHPHVFDENQKGKDLAEVEAEWEDLKKKQRSETKLTKPRFIDQDHHKEKKVVIFDWDGVIVDSVKLTLDTYKLIEKEFGVTFIDDWDNPRSSLFTDWKTHYVEKGLGHDEIKRSEEIFLENSKKNSKMVKVFTILREVIPKLASQFRLAIVSNNYRNIITKKLKKEGLLEYFEYVLGHEDARAIKPDPSAILTCMEVMCIQPEDVIYVGDMDGDVIAGKRAGVTTLAVTYGYHSPEQLKATEPHKTIDTPEKMLEAIQELH